MARKKTAEPEQRIWCGNTGCKNDACVRHEQYAPMGRLILVQKFAFGNGKGCKAFLPQWPDEGNPESTAKPKAKRTAKQAAPKKHAMRRQAQVAGQLSLF